MAVNVGAVYVDVRPSTDEFVKRMEADLLKQADELGERLGKQFGENISREVSDSVGKGISEGLRRTNTRDAERAGRDSGGAFARRFRTQVESALRNLPDVKIGVDTSVAAAVQAARAQLASLGDKTVGINLPSADALREIQSVRAALLSLRDRAITIEVRSDIDGALADLEKAEREFADRGDRSAGAFNDNFRNTLRRTLGELPTIDQDVAYSLDGESLAAIRAQAAAVLGKTDVELNLDPRGAIADITRVRVALETLRNQTVDLKVRDEIDSALKPLRAFEERMAGLSTASEHAHRNLVDLNDTIDRQLGSSFDKLRTIDIGVRADVGQFGAAIALIRKEISERRLLEIGINITDTQALAGIEAIRARLLSIRDSNVSVKVKAIIDEALRDFAAVDAAAAKLEAREPEIRVEANVGAFETKVRAAIAAATKAIPEIPIDGDPSKFNAELTALRARLVALGNVKIGFDMSAAQLLAELTEVQTLLAAIERERFVDVNVGVDAATAEAALNQVTRNRDAKINVKPELGTFGTQINAAVRKAIAALPKVKLEGEFTQLDAEIQRLRVRLEQLRDVRITAKMDPAVVLGEIKAIQTALLGIRDRRVSVQVDTDAGTAAAALAGVGKAATTAGEAGHASFNRMRLMVAAVIVLFPLLAAAIVALPAILSAIVAPIAAIAAGADGIKAAFAPLGPLMADLKTQVSAAFENGLAPAVQNIAAMFPTLTAGLVGTAQALSEVTTQVTAVYSSAQNLPIIADSFTRLNGVITGLGPSLASLNQNLIALVNIGAAGLVTLGTQMTAVGQTWAGVIATLGSTGVGAAAVQALVQVFASLLNLLAPLTLLGAELAAALGPALAGAINVLATVVNVLATGLGLLGNVFGPVGEAATTMIAAMTTLVVVMRVFGVAVPTATVSLAGFGTALFATGAAIRGFAVALAGLLLNPVVLAVGLLAVGLSALSGSFSDAEAAAASYQSYVDGLAGSLQTTGGQVTATTREFVASSEGFNQVKQSVLDAGVGLDTLTTALTGNDAALQQTRTAIQAQIDANKTWGFGLYDLGNGLEFTNFQLNDQGVVLQDNLNSLNQQAAGYDAAIEKNRELAEAISAGSTSMAGNLADAASLKESIATLGEEMSSTADKATALSNALTLLAGGTLPVEAAMAELGNTMSDIQEKLVAARDGAKEAGVGILDASGNINQATQAGRDLVLAYQDVGPAMSQAATSLFEAKGGADNLAQSLPAVRDLVQQTRDQFIEQQTAILGSEEAAIRYADATGLIPELVVSLLQVEGIPEATQDLFRINAEIANVDGKVVNFNIGAVSTEAQAVLQAIGFQVSTLENGEVVITGDDQATAVLQTIISTIQNTPPAELPVALNKALVAAGLPELAAIIAGAPPAQVPTAVDPAGVAAGAPGLQGLIENLPPSRVPTAINPAGAQAGTPALQALIEGLPPAQVPTGVNPAGVQAAAPALGALIAGQPPALIPTGTNNAGVATGVAAAQGTVSAAQAQLPVVLRIQPDTSLITAAVTFIRNNLANQTFNVTIGATDNATSVINGIIAPRTVTITINATDNASSVINGVIAARTVTVTINAVDNATGVLNGIVVARTVTVTANAETSGAAGALDTLAKPRTTTLTVEFGTVATAQTAYNNLAQPKSAVFTLTFPTIATAQTAYNNLAQAKSATFTVTTNLAAAQTAYDNLARNRSSTLTVNIATTGSVPTVPNATGNILPANLRAFARGGMMPAGKAAMVKPRTFRMIGDRSKDDEAYIPINKSARSQALLETTAQRMGRTLLPMAMGGVLGNGAAEALTRLASTLDKQRISTQSASSFNAPATSTPGRGGMSGGSVEARLDQMITLLGERQSVPPITVEDRSGNSVETARQVQLVLRRRH